MSCNPWSVKNIQEFSFLNCPECVFKVKEEDIFQDHAVKHHSLSSVLFGANISTKYVYIKTEPNEDLTEYDMIESKPNNDIIEHHMVETEFNEDIIENQLIKVEPSEDITEHQIKTEPDEGFTEDHIIDLSDNVVVDMNETHEELTYSDVEEKASISKQNKLKRRYNSNSEAELDEEQGHKKPKKSFARAEKKLEKKSGEIARKDPSDKLSKKAKICPLKIKHFKCSYCGEDYTQKEDLIDHMKSAHNTERFYQDLKCLYCEYIGWSEKMITEHIELRHPMEFAQNNKDVDKVVEKDVDIEKVDKIVNKTIKLRASNSEVINVTCPICDLPFMNKEIMEKHVIAVHDRKATYQEIYKKPTQSILAEPSIKIKCNFCDRTFKNDMILEHHMAFKHIDKCFEDISGEKKAKVWEHFSFNQITSEAKCVFCEGILRYKGSTAAMHDHLLKKHSISVPKAGSSIKTSKPSLKKATQSNFIQPPFKIKCNFCDRTFKSDIILKHHLAFKHSEVQK